MGGCQESDEKETPAEMCEIAEDGIALQQFARAQIRLSVIVPSGRGTAAAGPSKSPTLPFPQAGRALFPQFMGGCRGETLAAIGCSVRH